MWRGKSTVASGRFEVQADGIFDQSTFCSVEDLTLCQWREAATVAGGRFEENLLWINSCPVKDLPQWREAASVVPALTLCGVHSGEKQLQQWEMVEDLKATSGRRRTFSSLRDALYLWFVFVFVLVVGYLIKTSLTLSCSTHAPSPSHSPPYIHYICMYPFFKLVLY